MEQKIILSIIIRIKIIVGVVSDVLLFLEYLSAMVQILGELIILRFCVK
jgi:hypothetical protein